ncbi:MAG: phnP [candidate division NC10 bacterium]|nr:phnP [candidate division NC10 bacterium]
MLIELGGGVRVLVDTTPDLRSQALACGLDRVDAVLFTHCHADHVMGLDDVRRFNVLQQAAIPCYGDAVTLKEIRRTFAYIFESNDEGGGIPRIHLYPVGGPFSIGGEAIVPVPVWHGRREILGFRVRDFAYLTDCSGIPDASTRPTSRWSRPSPYPRASARGGRGSRTSATTCRTRQPTTRSPRAWRSLTMGSRSRFDRRQKTEDRRQKQEARSKKQRPGAACLLLASDRRQ